MKLLTKLAVLALITSDTEASSLIQKSLGDLQQLQETQSDKVKNQKK